MIKKTIPRWICWGLLGLLALGLAACAAQGATRLIAAHPQAEGPPDMHPIAMAQTSVLPANPQVIYTAALDLSVWDVENAAEQSVSLTTRQAGYLVNSQVWYQDDERQTLLVLAVPVARFDILRRELLRLGELEREQISGELVGYGGDTWYAYAQITVYLRPRSITWPGFSLPDWRPLHTLTQAWDVFLAIFGFLLDILIWIVVVPGPFVLAGWGVWRFLAWRRKKPGPGAGAIKG